MEFIVFWFLVFMTVSGYACGHKGMGFIGLLLALGCMFGGVQGVIGVMAFGLFFLTPLAILSK